MENKTESRISLRKTDDAARFLAYIDRSEFYTDFYETVAENDEALHEICCGSRTVGLAEIFDGGSKSYLYIYIFPEFRNLGYGREAARLAEQELMSPELKRTVTLQSILDFFTDSAKS